MRNKTDYWAWCFIVAVVALIITCYLSSCKKKDDRPKDKYYSVKYTMYSMNNKFVFLHQEDALLSGSIDTIRTNNYSVTYDVRESTLGFAQSVKSVIASSVDSLYLKAEYDGKKVEHGFRSTGGLFSITINLNEAK